MNERDILVLDALRENSRRSFKEIQKKTGLSFPTISRKIKKLQERGVIKKATVLVDWKKVGYPLHLFFSVEAEALEAFLKEQTCINMLFILRMENKCFFEAYFTSGAEADAFITKMEETMTTKIEFWEVEEVRRECFGVV